MRIKSVLCLLVVTVVAGVSGEDEWSWGKEDGQEEPQVSQGEATFSFSVSPEVEEEEEKRALGARSIPSIGVDVLPLEPHEILTEEELLALVEEEGGDREARFLGISEKLCSYGIGLNCNKKYPSPVKPQYGPAPKPIRVQTSYGAPTYKPPSTYGAPVSHPYPNRKHGTHTPPKSAPFSPLKGIMSAIESYLPGPTKPKYPVKGNQGVVAPSYSAPNPAYASLLPSYHPTPKPYAPQPTYIPTKPIQKVDYVAPKPAYVNPVYTVTVKESVRPTVIEHHSHTHTHVYKGDGVAAPTYHNNDPYYTQGSKQVFKRQESNTQGVDSIQDVLKQDQQRHETRVRVTSSVSSSHGVHPPQQQGFRPGRIEDGFKPMNTIPDTLFRQHTAPVPTYREDCQCVQASFCSGEDVVLPFTTDIRQFLDARNKKGVDILSNATDPQEDQENNAEAPQEAVNSIRRGRILGLSAERVFVNDAETKDEAKLGDAVPEEETETQTDENEEAVTEANQTEEESRVRRDVPTEDPVDESAAPSDAIPRQGRQLTGFTPQGGSCGLGHVCCRRPVYQPAPRTHQYSCGRRNAKGLLGRVKNPTVVFSEGDTEFGEYPWQAAILKRKEGDMMYVCGAALIDARHVLTAAHCVDGLNPASLKVRLGEWDVSAKSEFYTHLEMRVTGLYMHPEYYAGNLNNDLAVLRLEDFVDFTTNPHITPVCLPEEGAHFHERCHATGWGKDGFGSEGQFSRVLKEVEVPVVGNAECQQRLQQTRLGAQFSLHEGNLCAGGEAGRDTCEGDGGGPLVCPGPGGTVQLAGLVSWGIGCGHPGVPGVYVRVSHYLDWIAAITSA